MGFLAKRQFKLELAETLKEKKKLAKEEEAKMLEKAKQLRRAGYSEEQQF